MNETILGPAGRLELALSLPSVDKPHALALICHPHPLHGGTMDNKVVTTLARAANEAGAAAVRFNYRGVGQSEGQYDEGIGETEDAIAVWQWASAQLGQNLPLIACGFSFGCYVQTRLAQRVTPQQMILVGPAVGRFKLAAVEADTLIIHGEADEVVPLADVMAWARPQALPVTVFPGTGHFFHGQITRLRELVRRAIRARLAELSA